MLTTKLVNKIDEISPEIWKDLFPASLLDYNYFKCMERSDFAETSIHYILLYDDDKIIGIAPCFAMNYPLDTTISGVLKKLLVNIQRLFPSIFTVKFLMCGSVMGEGLIGISAHHKNAALKAIVEKMESVARDKQIHLLAFKDFFTNDTGLLNSLIGMDFCKFSSLPHVKLDINFKSFNDYLKILSPTSRNGLKRKLKKINIDELQMTVVDDISGSLNRIYDLYKQTYNKNDIKYILMPRNYFSNVSEGMKGRAKYFLWHLNGKLVAFSLCLASEDVLRNMFVGFDYSVAYEYHLFFATFCDHLKWCMEKGIKEYHSGENAYEAKRRLGLAFVPKYNYAKHTNRLVNPFFKLICLFMQPENFDKALKDYDGQVRQ